MSYLYCFQRFHCNFQHNMPYYSERTKYRKIFKDTYWGNFKDDCNDLKQEVIDNRNAFVEEFGICSRYNMPNYMHDRHTQRLARQHNLIDHVETYKTKDKKCVIVNSPYHVGPENETRLIEMGYIKYKHMYGGDSITFVFVCDIGKPKHVLLGNGAVNTDPIANV